MFIIGISGQTGAGKSTAAKILSDLGYGENLEVDSIGHLLLKDDATKQMLKDTFGADIIDNNGDVIRKKLGEKAFSSIENTEKLNSIMHPAMVKMVEQYIKDKAEIGEKYIIVNAALLFKMKLDKLCNKIIYVNAADEIRLERLVKYREMTEKDAKARLNSQDKLPENCSEICIINNDGTEEELLNKIKYIFTEGKE